MIMFSSRLRRLDFELAYLALLTRAEMKHLSRWEIHLAEWQRDILKELGLKVAVVPRRVRSGRRIEETIFSPTDGYIEVYLEHFKGKPVDRSPRTQRMEGALFGYPPCCVEHFLRKGYTRNSLPSEDQHILFHWACPSCRVTPYLVPRYREIYRRCETAFASQQTERKQPARKGLAIAASLTFLASGAGLVVPKAAAQDVIARQIVLAASQSDSLPDPHLVPLPIEADGDQDYLSDEEELHLGTHPDSADTDRDGVLDGIQTALTLWESIQNLPTEERETEPYRIDYPMWGLETCDACGEIVNMGFVKIINPQLNLACEIPYIGLHFMEHGGFSYAGDIHAGRLNVPLLNAALKSERDPHWLSVDIDSDGDGLADCDEAHFGCDETDPDTDDDGDLDGVELAVDMWRAIQGLPRSASETEPFALEMEMDGVEICQSCGEVVNMGAVLVTNPLEGLSATIPYIGLHYMEHGSFFYDGDYHQQGSINPRLVDCILKSKGLMHLLPVERDCDHDGLTDAEEIIFGLNPEKSDSNDDGTVDGVTLARIMRTAISELDTTASEIQPYIVEHKMRGIVQCPVCGTSVNMGYIEIINASKDLRVEVPYLALHFMELGSFAYGFDPGQRVDPIRIAGVLNMPLKGDINCDGRIDVTDVVSQVRFILGSDQPTPEQFQAADMNGDDTVNILDVVLLVRGILG